MAQIVGLVVDIGLGALAYNLARSLKANVAGTAALLAQVTKTLEEHEKRISALEAR